MFNNMGCSLIIYVLWGFVLFLWFDLFSSQEMYLFIGGTEMCGGCFHTVVL